MAISTLGIGIAALTALAMTQSPTPVQSGQSQAEMMNGSYANVARGWLAKCPNDVQLKPGVAQNHRSWLRVADGWRQTNPELHRIMTEQGAKAVATFSCGQYASALLSGRFFNPFLLSRR